MAKQKKNSNYVTEKTTAQKAQREEEKPKAKKGKEIKLIAIIAGATLGVIALIFGLLFAFGAFEYGRPSGRLSGCSETRSRSLCGIGL